jgi:hypothetical protein
MCVCCAQPENVLGADASMFATPEKAGMLARRIWMSACGKNSVDHARHLV